MFVYYRVIGVNSPLPVLGLFNQAHDSYIGCTLSWGKLVGMSVLTRDQQARFVFTTPIYIMHATGIHIPLPGKSNF